MSANASDVWIGASTGFIPIGSTSTPFTGSLDGQDHVIDGLLIHSSATPAVGLFSVIGSQGVVENLALTNASVTTEFTGNGYLGILAGYNYGTVQLSYSSGSVAEDGAAPNAASAGVGGLVGGNSGTIAQSASDATVTSNSGGDYVGGLVGALDQGYVQASYATGAVTAKSGGQSVGGLVGDAGNANPAYITQSYATGAVNAVNNAGGLLGYSNGTTITTSYATGSVTGRERWRSRRRPIQRLDQQFVRQRRCERQLCGWIGRPTRVCKHKQRLRHRRGYRTICERRSGWSRSATAASLMPMPPAPSAARLTQAK